MKASEIIDEDDLKSPEDFCVNMEAEAEAYGGIFEQSLNIIEEILVKREVPKKHRPLVVYIVMKILEISGEGELLDIENDLESPYDTYWEFALDVFGEYEVLFDEASEDAFEDGEEDGEEDDEIESSWYGLA